ncbi:MAG TPA: cation:proton antiporter, partial [Ignavibacteriaceae bacterium]|nr:cation:proton antiporter [Ignavibacteriaceae bacterium]
MSEHFLLALSSIVILGIGAQWLAWRLKLPSILLLLLFGFIAGPVSGFLNPDELIGDILLLIVSIAVALILFEGGLSLKIKELPKIGGALLSLLTIGVTITGVITAIAAYTIIGLNWQISILLGAILVVTGPTVIGPLLRHIRPKRKVADILKWEGIVIDPIGALFALLVFEAILIGGFEEASITGLIVIGKTVLFGSLVGFSFAWLLIILIKRFWIPDFLQETVTLSLVVGAFVCSNFFQHESGLFATTLMGIAMANQKQVTVKRILEFKENLSVLIISFLFIILSARLDLTV